MCGLAGILASHVLSADRLSAMAATLAHRGPDGSGYLLHGPHAPTRVLHNREVVPDERFRVGLAHRRLSILDLSEASLQPFRDEAAGVSVVYNGEIYNYVELRAELEARGHTFRTSGDTEVLLQAYCAWGPACVQRFNGMWAFVLLDERNRRVVFSRDRFGIKPLFYTVNRHGLFFASELKALAAVPEVEMTPHDPTVARFLTTGATDDTGQTFFAGIHRFPAAHNAVVSLDGPPAITPEPYWEVPADGLAFTGTQAEATDRFRSLFLDAVRVHARSDVPVGTCLSGGLDSSSIVCACEQLRSENRIPRYSHQAFGYTPDDPACSEAPFMQAVVDATGACMHYVRLTPHEFLDAVPAIIAGQDEPFASPSMVVQWAVFRAAREAGITVMLDGQGADEILGGYHSYFTTLASILLARKDLAGFWKLKRAHEKAIGPFPVSLAEALVRLAPAPWQRAARALRRRTRSRTGPFSIVPALQRGLIQAGTAPDPAHAIAPTSLRDVLRDHLTRSSVPALLRYEDRNAMVHSIESRVPFLDVRVVDFLFSLPDRWKISGASTKHVLREAMRGILPEAVRTRSDKMGFVPAPGLAYVLMDRLGTDGVENLTEWERRWFHAPVLKKLFAAKDPSPNVEYALWRALNVKLWIRHVLEQRSTPRAGAVSGSSLRLTGVCT